MELKNVKEELQEIIKFYSERKDYYERVGFDSREQYANIVVLIGVVVQIIDELSKKEV